MMKIKILICLVCACCLVGTATDAFAGRFSKVDKSDAPDGMKKADLFKKYKDKDGFGIGSKGRNEVTGRMKEKDSFKEH